MVEERAQISQINEIKYNEQLCICQFQSCPQNLQKLLRYDSHFYIVSLLNASAHYQELLLWLVTKANMKFRNILLSFKIVFIAY